MRNPRLPCKEPAHGDRDDPRQDRQFRPLPVPDVEVRGLFGERQDAICASTAATLLDRCIEAGMLDAIDTGQPSRGVVIPIGPWGGSHQMFWDSDIAKSIETIAYSLYRHPNPELEARADAIIDMYDRDAGRRRLPQRLVPARPARPPLDQPPRPPRALLRRPPDRGGGRLLPGHRQAQVPRRDVPLCRLHRHRLRPRRRPAPRLLRPRGDRARPGQARPRHRRAALHGPRQVLHRRAGPGAALLHRGSDPRRPRPGRVHPEDLRIQPGAPARPRAAQGRGPRRSRHVPLFRHGRHRHRVPRRQPDRARWRPSGTT